MDVTLTSFAVTVLKGSSDLGRTCSQRAVHSVYPRGQLSPPCLLPHCLRFCLLIWSPFLAQVYFFSLVSLFFTLFNLNFLVKNENKPNIRPSNFALANIPCQGTDPEHLPEDIFIAFGFIIDDKIRGIGFLFPRISLLVVYLKTRWYFRIEVIYKQFDS